MADSPSPPDDSGFVARLSTEIAQWEHEGLVRPDQAQTLRARYGLLAGETPKTLHRSRIVYFLSLLGAVLVGVGVILLIGANWQAIPRWARIALLIVSTAAAYQTGYWMAFQSKRYPKLGMALLLLGSVLWGASIFLISQTYQLVGEGGGAGERTATLYWFLGVLPLAYVLLSQLHLALSLVIGAVWLGMTLSATARMPFQVHILVYLGVGVLLYSLSRLHSAWRPVRQFAIPYGWLGLFGIFAGLYAFSFRDFWWIYGGELPEHWLPLAAVLIPAAVVVLALTLTYARRDRESFAEALGLLALLLLVLGIASQLPSLVMPAGYYSWEHGGLARFTLPMALFNLLLLAATVAVIALAWARHQPGLANFGMFVFFVQVVTRYFDLLKGMLSSGLMFVGAGLLLLVLGGVLERSRRKLLEAMAQRRQL